MVGLPMPSTYSVRVGVTEVFVLRKHVNRFTDGDGVMAIYRTAGVGFLKKRAKCQQIDTAQMMAAVL
jgi:hypothetical protein